MPIPAIRPRPRLARWLFDRGLEFRDGGDYFGCSHETLRLVCLPFDDPKRRVPNKELMSAIYAGTAGEITAIHFFPEQLTDASAPEPADAGLRLARAH